MQIVEYGSAVINDALVGDPLPQPDRGLALDGDPGYQSSQSCEDISIGSQLYTSILSHRQAPPNTLRISSAVRSNVSRSDSDLYHHSEMEVSRHVASSKRCAVYVSYTERMARWVRIVLKPLIESWEHSEVILHEDDMIPGFTVSGERQRLLLQAHKVVLVVSRDYSESPWCLYELQHAIQQNPALCRGRVIPILVDGCQELPSIVVGVVPLMENDRNFSSKLRKNIMGY